MATASSRVVRRASTTCISDDLATMQTASVWASTRWRSVSSSSARTPARRVEPNATRVDRRQGSSVRGPGEELRVLGIGPRPPALDEGHAEVVELLGHPQLVVHGQRQTLLLGAVPEGGVEDIDGGGQGGQVEVVPGVALLGCVAGLADDRRGPAGPGSADDCGWRPFPCEWTWPVGARPPLERSSLRVGPSFDIVQPVLVLVHLAAHGGEVGLLELLGDRAGLARRPPGGRRPTGSAPPRPPSRSGRPRRRCRGRCG